MRMASVMLPLLWPSGCDQTSSPWILRKSLTSAREWGPRVNGSLLPSIYLCRKLLLGGGWNTPVLPALPIPIPHTAHHTPHTAHMLPCHPQAASPETVSKPEVEDLPSAQKSSLRVSCLKMSFRESLMASSEEIRELVDCVWFTLYHIP